MSTKSQFIDEDTLEQEVGALCMSSAGRGRLTFQQNRHLFTYESLFLRERRAWRYAVYFPLQGEQSLLLSWKEETGSAAQLRGPLARWLENELKLEGREHWARQWDDFSLGLGSLLRTLSDPTSNCIYESEGLWNCDEGLMARFSGGDIEFTRTFPERYVFQAWLRQREDDGHKSVGFTLTNELRRADDGPLLGLELFLRECFDR
jgi:hypothetical protein